VTDRAYDFVARPAYQFQCEGIGVDDLVGLRIDNQDSGFHAIEDSEKLLAIFAQRGLGVFQFGAELGNGLVAGLLAGFKRRPFVDTQNLFRQGRRLLAMAAHSTGLFSAPSPPALTAATKAR
jgi:hypothetical protein